MRRLVVAVTVVAVLLAGCGGSDDSSNGDASKSPDPTSEAAGTVAIKHRFGTTEVPIRPQRVVSLDVQWTDVLLALDEPPTGYLLDYNLDDGFPWRGDGLSGATGISATTALPYEKIADLDPDLIVVQYFAQSEEDYKILSAIAPTITTLSTSEVDTWQEIARTAGRIYDAPAKATALIDKVEGEVATVAQELPALEGKTFALVNFVPGDALHVVSDPDDGAVALFTQLGMSIAPTIVKAGEGGPGRVELSLEQANLLDADLLVFFTNGGDPEEIVGYDKLPAVKAGAVSVLDYATVSGLNTPTPLSVPYSLEKIRPALEAVQA